VGTQEMGRLILQELGRSVTRSTSTSSVRTAEATPFTLSLSKGDKVGIAPGIIVTIAGTGEPGYAGDSGPALKALLNEPKSLTVAGNFLYIADAENHRVRRLDLASGIITTVAGGGPGDEVPSSAGPSRRSSSIEDEDPLADPAAKEDRYVQLPDQSGTVRFLTGTAEKGRFRGDGGHAENATLNFPSAVAVDS